MRSWIERSSPRRSSPRDTVPVHLAVGDSKPGSEGIVRPGLSWRFQEIDTDRSTRYVGQHQALSEKDRGAHHLKKPRVTY